MGFAHAVLAAGVAVAAATAEPAPGSTSNEGGNVITQPDWLRRPSAEAMAREYPKLATAMNIEGYAVLACTVTAQGSLTGCRAVTERPAGLGFGRAAIALGAHFEMKPMTLNGKPVDGGKINIPIRFQLPVGAEPAEPPAPVSPEAARQAQRVIESTKAFDKALDDFMGRAKEIETMDATVAPGVGRDAADAFRRSVEAHRGDFHAGWARAFASVFSESELSDLADFYASSAAMARTGTAYTTGQEMISKDYIRNVTVLSHQVFCAKVACDVAADIRKVWRAGDPRDASRIDIPLWETQPGVSRLRGLQPKLAGLLGLTGVVRMTCRVGDKGGLVDCAADEEAPAGLGYGAAALKAAGDYRLNDIQLAAGAAGRKVTVRVGFPPPAQTQPYHPPRGEGRLRELAHKIADLEGSDSQFQLDTELQITDLATNPPKTADDKVYQVALESYREGVKRAVAAFVDASADNLAGAFTEPQLQAFLAFRSTPAGKAERTRRKELTVALANAQGWATRKVIADAKAAFCATHGCAAPAAPVQPPKGENSAPSTAKP
jgi:TonB family protein